MLYTCLDAIWIYFDSYSKIPKIEMYLHHAATIIAIFVPTPEYLYFHLIRVFLVEITSLLLLLLKLPSPSIIRICMKHALSISWIILRVIGFPINIHIIKYYDYPYVVHGIIYLNYNIIYLLNLKWTLQFFKQLKYDNHYTSILLSAPLLLSPIPIKYFYAVNTLTYISYINHSIKNRWTNIANDFAIVQTCLIYLNIHPVTSVTLGVLCAVQKYANHNPIYPIKEFIYVCALFYYCLMYPIIFCFVPFMFCGLYIYIKYKDERLWHTMNGLYLFTVTYYIS